MLYQFIVYSNTENLMLFDSYNGSLFFPHFHSVSFHIADTEPINEHFSNKYQLNTNVLKCWYKDDSQIVYEVEVLDEKILMGKKESIWLSPYSPESLSLLTRHDKWIIKKWGEHEPRLMPWFQYGFRKEIEKWIKSRLSDNIHAIKQIRSWEKGSLLKAYGENSNYYIKTVPPIFDHEPFVHKNIPEYSPEVISVDEQWNTYIMEEIKGTTLGYSRDIYQWKLTAISIAKLQKKYIHGEIKIKKMLPIWPIENILTEKNLGKVIRDMSGFISKKTYHELARSISDVVSLIQLLTAKLPSSLDHGDLFGGNVKVEEGKPLIFDWSNSSITHPFLSVVHLIEEVADFFSEDTSNEVLNDYLKEWNDYGKLDALTNEFIIIRLLAPIYYLSVHMLYIFPSFQDNVDKKEIIDGYVYKWLVNIKKIKELL